MRSRKGDTIQTCETRSCWWVGIARKATIVHSYATAVACKGNPQKRAGAKDRLPKMSAKFALHWGKRAIWKPKSQKIGMVGRLFEIAGRKICTRLWRESHLEAKLVERWHDGIIFGRSGRQNLHHAVAQERLGSQNR